MFSTASALHSIAALYPLPPTPHQNLAKTQKPIHFKEPLLNRSTYKSKDAKIAKIPLTPLYSFQKSF